MIQREFYQTYTANQNDFLSHHGILGQKWGVRRYQNKDGSLTEEGRIAEKYGFERAPDWDYENETGKYATYLKRPKKGGKSK